MSRALEIAAFIRTHEQQIIAEWTQGVANLPGERRLSPPALIDHMPDVLARLATWIEQPSPDATERVEQMASHHALQRLGHGLELRQVIAEYGVLRATALALFEAGAAPGTPMVTVRFNEGIDRAIAECVDAYAGAFELARERFVDMLAHDLRNPLLVISVAAQMLAEGSASTGNRTMITNLGARIARNSRRMESMIDDLLDFARGRHGQGIPVTLDDADMGEICHQVIDEASFADGGRTIHFASAGNLAGRWDADRVNQAITNLLTNALAHGEDPIAVDARDLGADVEVTVSNAGPPIDARQLPTIFEPYQLGPIADAAAPRSRVGLGLGLFIVREVVRAHGGSVDVRSDATATEFVTRWPRTPPR